MSRIAITPLLILLAGFAPVLLGQNQPVLVEAESGVRGAEMAVTTEGSVQYVATTTNSTGQNPASSARVVSYTVTFPAAATYDLYARIRVGPGGFDDDSFFYGNGFGAKSPTNDDDWTLVNGLSGSGHTASTDVVTGAGTAGNGVWKWLKLSEFSGGETPLQFTVGASALTQTFQIGAREDGLQIDKFAFGRAGVTFTVANLDNNQAGTPAATTSTDPYTPPGPPLATGKAKYLGSAYNPSSGQSTNFEKYWNQVVPENAGKWGSVEGTRNVMNWTALDAAYNFAKANGFPFRFHVLVWGNQQPAWIETLPPAEQLREIEEWFAAVAARYPDIDILEVVNEPWRDPPNQPGGGGGNYLSALGGTGATGWDWLLNAFRIARLYFPSTRLMLNEYSVTNSANNAATYVQLIQLLKNEGLIDVIGIQAHAFETRVSAAVTKANLDTIAATGLPIYVTEMDIDGPSDQVQLDDYKRIFPVFWEHPAVRGITLWGYRPGLWRNEQGAFLVLANGAERPAMQWLAAYVRNNPPVVTAGQIFAVAPGAANGAAVGTVVATDADAGSTLQGWQISGGTGASLFAINAATGALTVANGAGLTGSSYTLNVRVGDGIGNGDEATVTVRVSNLPVVAAPPAAQRIAVGGTVTLGVTAVGAGPFTYQWRRNGVNLAGATGATLELSAVQPAQAGVYTAVVTNAAGAVVTTGAVVGTEIQTKVVGTGTEVGANIVHPNGNVYDQILLTGTAASITADAGQIVRTSYIDLNDDIVQVEFAGAGTLTITLDGATGPALPVNYNQSVEYMRGHATLTIVGADQSTNVSAFTVGTGTAVNQALFKAGTNYDGVADLALVNVTSTNGQFGGIRLANAGLFAATGLTGVNAPGVNVVGPVNVHNVSARDDATPVLLTGTVGAVTVAGGGIAITGGDMFQDNGRAVQLGGAQAVAMRAGENSHRVAQPARANRAVYERNGVNVTATVVTGP